MDWNIGAILVAKGKISSYVWGFVGTALYLYISYQYKLYGETITYALLFLPMQVSGYYYWIRNSKEADTDVIKKVMTTKQRIWLFVGTATAIAAYAAFLRYLEGAMPGLDSATAILSIVATTLMVMRYAEQWLIWILVNTVAVVMWVLAVLHHQDQGFAVLAMWSTFWLTIPYRSDDELDKSVHDLLTEISQEADMRNCFVEMGAWEEDTEKRW